MKTLLSLCLLLLCLSGRGQDYKPSVTNPVMRYDTLPAPHPDKGWRGQYIDTTDSVYVGDRMIPVFPFSAANIPLTPRDLVSLWDEYSQECWNDSTSTDVSYCGVFFDGEDNIFYFHRDPTLEGFIEFMRKKYKIPIN